MSAIPKVRKDDNVAVLISRGFGAGWFSWHGVEELLYDPTVVELVLKKHAEMEYPVPKRSTHEIDEIIVQHCVDTYGDDIYLGGVDGLTVVWVLEGEKFIIEEYDGAEHIVFEHEMEWMVA